jgi:hypothetical protein
MIHSRWVRSSDKYQRVHSCDHNRSVEVDLLDDGVGRYLGIGWRDDLSLSFSAMMATGQLAQRRF